jgi:hypothetical protein
MSREAQRAGSAGPPLVVDIDRTLLPILLVESIFAYLGAKSAPDFIGAVDLARGNAPKAEIAGLTPLTPQTSL